MKIVIAGAGSVGYHLAKLLTKENQNITLIDTDDELLDQVASKLDIMTIQGDASSIEILKEADVARANLFIAVTTSEKTNLLTAILAKQKGASKTIARVNNPEYLHSDQAKFFSDLGIDTLISPLELAAQEIKRLIRRASFTDIFEFEDGQISIVGFTVDNNSPLAGKTVANIEIGHSKFDFRGVALLRDHKTIIPRGHTTLQKGDHLYLSIQSKHIDEAIKFAGKQIQPIKKIMIVGGTPLALRTAQILENDYSITTITETKKEGKVFVQQLNNSLVTVSNPGNLEMLKQEGLANMDAFVALTPDSEINILSSLLAEDAGVYKSIALVDNDVYTHISKNIGVDTIINKKIIAANNIFTFVRKGRVEAIATLHGVDAEIIEFEIHKQNRVTSKPLSELKIPDSAIVAGVVRGSTSFIPGAEFILQQKDKIIVFALPEAIRKVEELFK